MRDLVNAGAVELVAATVDQGASSDAARAWWGNFLVQKANEDGVELDELPITPAQVAAVVKLVDGGTLSNKLARQVVEGVLAGEGEPDQVMRDRGLEVVRDDSALQAAVDEARQQFQRRRVNPMRVLQHEQNGSAVGEIKQMIDKRSSG